MRERSPFLPRCVRFPPASYPVLVAALPPGGGLLWEVSAASVGWGGEGPGDGARRPRRGERFESGFMRGAGGYIDVLGANS